VDPPQNKSDFPIEIKAIIRHFLPWGKTHLSQRENQGIIPYILLAKNMKREVKDMDAIDAVNPQVPYFGFHGLSCSESTLRCLIERGVVDLPLETVKMMTGMHGGAFGHGRGAMCGALTGGAAALGWVLGRTEPDQSSKRLIDAQAKFVEAFEQKFGGVSCDDLLIYEEASKEQLTRCADQIVFAVDYITKVIEEERGKGI